MTQLIHRWMAATLGLLALIGLAGCRETEPCGRKDYISVVQDLPFDISGDGSVILYAHAQDLDGPGGVYRISLGDAIHRERILEFRPAAGLDPGAVRLSPDGTKLVYERITWGDIGLWDLVTKTETRLTRTEGNASEPDWSPDGTRIVYSQPLERVRGDSTEGGLFVLDLVSRIETPILSAGQRVHGGHPRWSPDGAWIAYSTGSPREARVVSLATGEVLRVSPPSAEDAEPVGWLNEGPSIVYVSHDRQVCETSAYDVAGRARHGLGVDVIPRLSPGVVSADGRWFVTVDADSSGRFGILYLDSLLQPGHDRRPITGVHQFSGAARHAP